MLSTSSDSNIVLLKSLMLNIHIKHSICSLIITQTFENSGNKPLLCICKLPLLLESAVSSLEVIYDDGRRINSRINSPHSPIKTSKDPLLKDYKYLLNESDKNLAIVIGNLALKEKITTKINVIFELNPDRKKNAWYLDLPIDSLQFPQEMAQLEVIIESSTRILKKFCSWKVKWAEERINRITGSAKVKLNADSNLKILYKNEEIYLPTAVFQEKNGKYAVMLSFVPNSEDVKGAGEYILIIDRSGSMSGSRIKLAQESAILILNNIPPNSKFNVVSFGTEAKRMHDESLFSSTSTINCAINEISRFEADMEGTDIDKALKKAYKNKPHKSYPRVIFLITDGGGSCNDKLLKEIRNNISTTRLYTFGINPNDDDANFLKDIAEMGNGYHFLIKNAKKLKKRVINAFKRCTAPCISNVASNSVGDAAPDNKSLGIFYHGERFAQFILMDRFPADSIKLKFHDTNTKANEQYMISKFFKFDGDEFFKYWAKYKISEMEKFNHAQAMSTSFNYQVPSKLTKFICVRMENSNLLKIPCKKSSKILKESLFASGVKLSSFYGQGYPFPIIKIIQAKIKHGSSKLPVISLKKRQQIVDSDEESKSSSDKEEESKSSNHNYEESRRLNDSDDSKSSNDNYEESISSNNSYKKSKISVNGDKESQSSNDSSEEKVLSDDSDEDSKSSFDCDEENKSWNDSNHERESLDENEKQLKQKKEFDLITARIKSQGYWAYTDMQMIFPDVINCKRGLECVDDNIFSTIFMASYLSLNFPNMQTECESFVTKAENWLSKYAISIGIREKIDDFIKKSIKRNKPC